MAPSPSTPSSTAILRYWFDRGVAGVRIDVAHGLYKDALLRDNPPAGPSDHPAIQRGKLRPVYSSHRPEVHGIYRQWRQIADGYEHRPALLGETWEFDYDRFGDYYGRDEPELHMGFNFSFVESPFSARGLAASGREHSGRPTARGHAGMDGVQPRRGPVPDPLVRR